MDTGIYIHIPFCKSRCIYCGFYSTTSAAVWKERYIEALLKEMRMRRREFDEIGNAKDRATVDTVYIGGGTPSTLAADDIGRIMECIHDNYAGHPREVTMEANPDDVTAEYISAIRRYGVNRISMGVQTFSDERLKFIRRRHSALVAEQAVDTVRQAGIENVSIDLMFGFPGETIADWQSDINNAIRLNPSHISAYSLMYEEGTILQSLLDRGEISITDDDTYLAMYAELIDTLAANGYEQYEISNFARSGYRSIHNSSYWQDKPYIGFGAAAHSYTNRTRSWNVSDIKTYTQSIENGARPFESEQIDDDTHYNDIVTTAMRTREGIRLSTLPEVYRNYAINCAKKNIATGLLEESDGYIRLTRRGLFVSDMVMSDLMKV